MQLLLYIQVKAAENIRYGNPFSSLAKNHDGLILLDADNHSEELVINHQIQMLKEVKEIILVLDVIQDTSPGKTVRLIEKLIRQKDVTLRAFLHGTNTIVENMLKLSKATIQSGLGQEEIYTAVEKLISAN